jgi:hypothetical protein
MDKKAVAPAPDTIIVNVRRHIFAAIRVFIVVFLLWWIVGLTDFELLIKILGRVDALWLILGLCATLFTHVLNCWRWRLCLFEEAARIRFSSLLLSYFTAIPVGMFLPSEYGGDLLRAHDVGKSLGNYQKAAASVILSRLSGILSTFIIFLLAGLFFFDRITELGLVWLWLTILAGTLFFGALIISPFKNSLKNLIAGLDFRISFLNNLMRSFLKGLEQFSKAKAHMTGIILSALAAQGAMILANGCYAMAVGQPINMVDIVFLVPVITLASMIPISPGGIGVKEAAFLLFFQALGLSEEGGISLAIANRGGTLFVAMIGTVFIPARRAIRPD